MDKHYHYWVVCKIDENRLIHKCIDCGETIYRWSDNVIFREEDFQ